ncbi:MAG: AI-2E family transporter [Alphaproteobacteria bacterium]|nr:AI-2E family transporter [Alphaproteobacteria bacterium]
MTTPSGGSGTPPARQIDAVIVDIAIKLLLLGLFTYWSLKLLAPFVGILIWAAILATAIFPLHAWLRRRMGGRALPSSIILTALGLGLLLGPAGAIIASLASSLQDVASEMMAGTFHIPVPNEAVRSWPVIGPSLYSGWEMLHEDLAGLIGRNKSVVVSAGGWLLEFAAGVGGGLLMLVVSILIMGFLLCRASVLADGAKRFAGRIGGERARGFVDLAGATVRNVSRGVIGVSLLQSMLAGIGLLVAGVPAAGLITIGALILAIVQIGPGILLLPVIGWVWWQLDTLTAILFTVYMIPVLTFDNVLKPMMMAHGLKTPMLVIFIGVIGGTLTHGLLGLFLGPVVLAVAHELLIVWLDTPNALSDEAVAERPPAA